MKKTAIRIFVIIAAVMIALYVYGGRTHWFSEAERQVLIGESPLYSDVIDLSSSSVFTWQVPKDNWVYESGDAQISLVLERSAGDDASRFRPANSTLRVRIGAYGLLQDGRQIDRLVQNWYYTTNEPLSSQKRRLGSSWGAGRVELTLGAASVYYGEELFVKLEILTGDSFLAEKRPRLKIVGDYDHAIFGHIWLPRLLRDGGLVLTILLLSAVVVIHWRTTRAS